MHFHHNIMAEATEIYTQIHRMFIKDQRHIIKIFIKVKLILNLIIKNIVH
jgi:hypothetical protein